MNKTTLATRGVFFLKNVIFTFFCCCVLHSFVTCFCWFFCLSSFVTALFSKSLCAKVDLKERRKLTVLFIIVNECMLTFRKNNYIQLQKSCMFFFSLFFNKIYSQLDRFHEQCRACHFQRHQF